MHKWREDKFNWRLRLGSIIISLDVLNVKALKITVLIQQQHQYTTPSKLIYRRHNYTIYTDWILDNFAHMKYGMDGYTSSDWIIWRKSTEISTQFFEWRRCRVLLNLLKYFVLKLKFPIHIYVSISLNFS